MKLLVLSIIIFLTGCGGSKENIVEPLPDTTDPVITLTGDSSVNLFLNESYTEQGASAHDDVDGAVDVIINGAVDVETIGTYSITYTATDHAGNSSSVGRTVNVVLPPDTTAPVITLNGEATVTLFLNDSYTEQGATALDDRDSTVEVVITGTVDTSTLGTYTITYSATDNAGNNSSAERTVNVVLPPDTIAPVITLNGESSISLVINTAYTEQGGTAVDDRDGSVEVVITGSVDTSTLGTYTITYSATDNAGNSSSVTRSIVVNSRPFITIWEAKDNSLNKITIGTLGDNYDFQVDWGDGNIDEHVTGDITHEYADEGEYRVEINGDFPQLYFRAAEYYEDGEQYFQTDNYKLLSVEQWGDIVWSSMHQAFVDCHHLVINATDKPNLSKVTNMKSMFRGAISFNQDISGWDVSNVTNMEGMFLGAISFNQDISGWNVSNVINMESMFRGNNPFNADFGIFNQDLSDWDVSNVINMEGMFKGAIAFNQDISAWDVSSVSSMESMFEGAITFNQDINAWNVSNVTNMKSMFQSASDFNQDLGGWDVSNVINIGGMFRNAINFNKDITTWDVSNIRFTGRYWEVNGITSLFEGAISFNQNISDWDVSNIVRMSSMFKGASAFNQDISDWNVSSVARMDSMFEGASAFNQDIGSWVVSSVFNMRSMFANATSFNQELGSWDVSHAFMMEGMFSNVTLSTNNYDELLIGWSGLSLQSQVNFDAGSSKYSDSVQGYRDVFTNSFGWSISDGGIDD